MLSPLRAKAPPAVERAALAACVALLVVAAWAGLWLAGDASFLHLHHLGHHHVPVTGGFLLLFVASWTVMTVAMMLPTSLPIVATLYTIAGQRADRALLAALTIVGYLTVWAVFGALVVLGYLLWHWLTSSSPWLAQHTPAGAPLLLIVAGAFQFSRLKYRCLDKCRSPLSQVMEHWQGRRERRDAFRLGVDHGLFCIGCCWALMLLMFAVSVGSLIWMLILALVMGIEKNVRWGRRLSAPVGVALLAWGLVL